jgi:hypothetical protein
MDTKPKETMMALITYSGGEDLVGSTMPDLPRPSAASDVGTTVSSFAVNTMLGGLQRTQTHRDDKRATIVRSLPLVYVRVGPDETAEFIKGILDTGSEVNIIPEEYVEANGLAVMPLDEEVNSKGIHATVVPFLGRVTERLYIAGRWTVCEFMVMPKRNMDAVILLGMAFISDTHLSFQWVTDQYGDRTMRANFVLGTTRMIVTCQSDVTATQVRGARIAGPKNM